MTSRPSAPLLVMALLAVSSLAPAPAEAAKWKQKKAEPAKHHVAATHPGTVGGTASDGPTGALGASGPAGESIGRDCFVVKKRALVPGTGYVIRKSTFCN
ncbi:MAG: hypothetical protein U1E62_09630 [Alsobacter sp.]